MRISDWSSDVCSSDLSMAGAMGVIVSIVGGEDMRLMEVDEAANHIRELVDPDANIIWGSAFNESLEGKIRVSVVATGIDGTGERAAPKIGRAPCWRRVCQYSSIQVVAESFKNK